MVAIGILLHACISDASNSNILFIVPPATVGLALIFLSGA